MVGSSQLCLGGNQCGGDFGDAVGSSGRFLAKVLNFEVQTTRVSEMFQLISQSINITIRYHQILWVVAGDKARCDHCCWDSRVKSNRPYAASNLLSLDVEGWDEIREHCFGEVLVDWTLIISYLILYFCGLQQGNLDRLLNDSSPFFLL